ncbi:hypothetical protein KAFR_0F03480 [Kazachstania africana CBS 2517]|uniref:AB hydrolase-1 domain-containing protein n=1 Tax=Kazachstania africana (strain ATCC 22294 / BCRC 22015 / CBS 2517 / CECT 1963 / NBRC 1671 / NRRL Y-8276) TaxID=1071382 RepID=H2AX44_KAZAF|nr:hypothetical protein KAFR_0F03480 [Kazachstania africana CBS 2517]CCF58944.1 hypothetical protein KAFR_0F03480 [Kazachstania africana CBS 2517]
MQKMLPTKPLVKLSYLYLKPSIPSSTNHIILNLHGFLGSKSNFHSINRRLSKAINAHIFTFDLRNHGESELAHPLDYETLANDFIHFLGSNEKQFKNKSIDIIGYSMGGKVALLSSLKLNKSKNFQIRKIISVDMPPYEVAALPAEIYKKVDAIKYINLGAIKIKSNKDGSWKVKLLEMLGPYFTAGFMKVRANYKGGGLVKYYLPLEEFPSLFDDLKDWPVTEEKSNADVLFIRALKSNLIKDDYSLLERNFKRVKVKEFDSDHNILFNNFENSITCIIDFLQDKF